MCFWHIFLRHNLASQGKAGRGSVSYMTRGKCFQTRLAMRLLYLKLCFAT